MSTVKLELTNEELAVQKHLLKNIIDAAGKDRAELMRDYGTFCHACRQLRVAAPLTSLSTVGDKES